MPDSTPEGAIPVDQFVADSKEQAPPGAIPIDQFKADSSSEAAPEGAIPVDQFVPDQDKKNPYATPGEQALTIGENVAKGIAGPVATGAERLLSAGAGALGFENAEKELSPEAQKEREAANPLEAKVSEYGSLGASFLYGAGEARLLMSAGKAAAEAAGFGKLGSTVIKGLVEGGMLGAGDAASEVINGDSDPEAPVASSLAHIGAGGLMGAATGGATAGLFDIGATGGAKALRALSDTKVGNSASKFIQDLGNRWNWLKNNIGTPEAVTGELTNLHQTVQSASNAARGNSGLKNQAVDLLSKEVGPAAVSSHIGDVSNMIDRAPKAIQEYAPYQEAIEEWRSKVAPAPDPANMFAPPKNISAADAFKATEELKGKLADIVYGPGVTTRTEVPLMSGLERVRKGLQGSLEDTNTWGRLGKLQADVNSATHEFLPALQDFNSKATLKVEKTPVVDPDKITNLVKSFGKDKKSLQKGMVGSFVESAKNYIDQVNGLYNQLGVESAIPHVSTNETDMLLKGSMSAGAKFADFLHNTGAPSFANKIAGTVAGADTGAKLGGLPGALVGGAAGYVVPYLEQALGRPIKEYAIPGVLRALGSGKPEAVIDALEHVENIHKGQAAMRKAVNGLFTGVKISEIKAESNKEKLKKFIDQGGLHDQIQDQLNQSNQASSGPPVQNFASGGEVNQMQMPSPPSQVKVDGRSNKLSDVYPEQTMLMAAAKGRVYNYLNSVKPQENTPRLPFDEKHKDREAARKYDRALTIAANPLSVVKHIQDGTLEPEQVGHMKQMWPEIHNQLSKKIMQKVIDSQMKGEKPPYRVRQSLSLFIGSALDTNLTPQNIMAAQATFAKAKPPEMPGKGKGTSTKGLSDVSNQFRTKDQAVQERQLRSKA